MEFVLNNLEVLEKGSTCISIIPVSCVNEFSGNNLALKEMIQKQHTVAGVMSVPADLFHNSKTNVVTCLLIKAHTSKITRHFAIGEMICLLKEKILEELTKVIGKN